LDIGHASDSQWRQNNTTLGCLSLKKPTHLFFVENEEKLWKEKMGEHYFLGREVTAAAGVNFASLNN